MKNYFLVIFLFLLQFASSAKSDSLALSILSKCQKAHADLSNKRIEIDSRFYQKNGESFSTKGEAFISKSATYVKMMGIENISFPDKGIMVQVQESEKMLSLYTLNNSPAPSIQGSIDDPDVLKALKGLVTSVDLQFKLVANNNSYYLIHVFSLQSWTYDLVAIKILKSSYLIHEITFISGSQHNSDVNKASTSYQYSDIGPLPEKMKLDFYIEKKNKKWFASKRFSGFKLNDFTS